MLYLYGLFDPRNQQLRYVGLTNNLRARYASHISKAKYEILDKSPKRLWIVGLLEVGMQPEAKPLALFDDKCVDFAKAIEAGFISNSEGLVNTTYNRPKTDPKASK